MGLLVAVAQMVAGACLTPLLRLTTWPWRSISRNILAIVIGCTVAVGIVLGIEQISPAFGKSLPAFALVGIFGVLASVNWRDKLRPKKRSYGLAGIFFVAAACMGIAGFGWQTIDQARTVATQPDLGSVQQPVLWLTCVPLGITAVLLLWCAVNRVRRHRWSQMMAALWMTLLVLMIGVEVWGYALPVGVTVWQTWFAIREQAKTYLLWGLLAIVAAIVWEAIQSHLQTRRTK